MVDVLLIHIITHIYNLRALVSVLWILPYLENCPKVKKTKKLGITMVNKKEDVSVSMSVTNVNLLTTLSYRDAFRFCHNITGPTLSFKRPYLCPFPQSERRYIILVV